MPPPPDHPSSSRERTADGVAPPARDREAGSGSVFTGPTRSREEILADTRRLETIGLLAGGVAHDFNNLLAVVRANVELARDALLRPQPDLVSALDDLQEVDGAVRRAERLVRQLLAYGRRQARAPEALDLGAIVRESAPLLRRFVGDRIELSLHLGDDAPPAFADRAQVEQILMNLVLNARDAIVATDVAPASAAPRPDGRRPGRGAHGYLGALTVVTDVTSVDDAAAPRAGVPQAGEYAVLEVRDTGIGMDEGTRARIFEPFFTTKPVDQGTGLGLAATWGIVVQSGGGITVRSRPGEGSTFRVLLPAAPRDRLAPAAVGVPAFAEPAPFAEPPAFAAEAAASASEAAGSRATGARDTGDLPRPTILLAEDDHALRRALGRILRAAGYRVLEAGDGQSALELWRAHGDEVALLLADVRMPRLRGDELAVLITADRPGHPVVLMTGFGDEGRPSAAPHVRDDAGVAARPLAKPFATAELLERIGAALARAPRGERTVGSR